MSPITRFQDLDGLCANYLHWAIKGRYIGGAYYVALANAKFYISNVNSSSSQFLVLASYIVDKVHSPLGFEKFHIAGSILDVAKFILNYDSRDPYDLPF